MKGGMRATFVLSAALLWGCANVEGKLKDLSWGAPVKADYESMVVRAREQVLKRYPKGLDPDRTDEDKGDFWTVWHNAVAVRYRDTTRSRAHVKVEDLGDGQVRIGVAVVKQINDNIDNPHDISEARWVRTEPDEAAARLLYDSVILRTLSAEPSEYWKERNRTERRPTMREDLIDRSKDVDLAEAPDADDVKHLDPVTGDAKDK
jgi:hypothetical protein